MRYAAIAVLLMLPAVGCIPPAVIANQAGFLSGTGYLAVNNPPVKEVESVKSVLGKINKYVVQLEPKDTFAKLYKPISAEISGELDGVQRILALSVTRTALDGLDILFAANPDWAERKDLVVSLTREFVGGVNRAFTLFAADDGVLRNTFIRTKAASTAAYEDASSP